MGSARTRSIFAMAVVALLLAACGGGGDSTATTTAAPASDSAAETDTETETEDGTAAAQATTDEAAADEGDATAEAPGERSAVITVDGESTTYALDDVTFSPVEGVDDLTFETCNPDFFGSGRFYAIGYAVDADGELIMGDDDQPGTFTMDLPPDDWETAQRDAPEFEIKHAGLDIEIATPEEAAGETMSWSIDDTTASGTAVFVDFENSYTVDFEVICEGSPTFDADDLPEAAGSSDDADSSGGGGGLPPAGGVGSFTVDGEPFDNVDIYSCEPFSFGSDPDPRDLSLFGYQGGMDGLNVEVSYGQGFDPAQGVQAQFDDQIRLTVFYSRSGEGGTYQFEGSAANGIDGTWYVGDFMSGDPVALDEAPVVIDGDRITGSLAGLDQTWPDEGADTVDVSWDFEIPSEVIEEC